MEEPRNIKEEMTSFFEKRFREQGEQRPSLDGANLTTYL